jgi:hypothetical protein
MSTNIAGIAAPRMRAACDIPIRVEIDDSGWFDILPFGRPNFPGRSEDRRPGALARSDRGAA